MIGETKIVVIGCGAAGGTAAQLARKTNRKAKITIFEKGKYSQYSKCGLPYVISGQIKEFNDLVEFSKNWFEKERIDIFLETTVDKINIKNRKITTKKKDKKTETEYDKLIIATGAEPFIPPIENIWKNNKLIEGVNILRTIDDGKRISSEIEKGKYATIIGAGLIGLEIAEALYKKGMRITIIEALPGILENTLDNDMSEPIHKELQDKINIYTNHITTKVEQKQGKIKQIVIKNTITNKERKIDTDILVIATGTKPNISLAKNIGCKIGKTNGIIVNERTETSVNNVYAVGDCTEYKDFVTAKATSIGLGSIAVRQGIAAGINAAGNEYVLPKGLLNTRTSKFFGFEVAAVGPLRNACEKIPVIYGKFTGSSLLSYFPGGEPISIKIGVNKETGEIVSAQAVGSNAAQRINVCACAILNSANVEAVRKLETAYAPSIAPTLDVLTIACDVAFLKYSRNKR